MKAIYTSVVIAVGLVSTTAFGQTNTFPASGNVGLGTTSPTSLLHLTGSGTIEAQIASDAGSTSRPLVTYLRGSSYWVTGMNVNQSNTNDFGFRFGGSTIATFQSGGNVGIGTTAPLQKLDVRGNLLLENSGHPFIYTGTGSAELNRYVQLLNSPTPIQCFRFESWWYPCF